MNCADQHQDEQPNDYNSGDLSLSQYFTRVDDVDSLTPDDFIDRFERYGFLWFKGKGSKSGSKMPTGKHILDFVKLHSSSCEKSWTIENHSKDTLKSSLSSEITPEKVLDFMGTNTSFYVSTIVHRKLEEGKPEQSNYNCTNHQDGNNIETSLEKPNVKSLPAHQSLMEMLPRFDNVFEDIYENGDPSGTWLFLGHHGVSADPASTKSNTEEKPKKRRLCHDHTIQIETKTTTLIGRAEHVDEVTHSGTYHIQISGTKTWKIRPHPDSLLAEELMIDSADGKFFKEIPGAMQEDNSNGSKSDKYWRIKINVEEGDVFVLNTKIWYHCTELHFSQNPAIASMASSSEWSISVAQDFYLPIPCPRDVKKGDVVYGYLCDGVDEDDVNHEIKVDPEIPDELPRSENPNCVLVEIAVNEQDNDSEDEHDNDEMSAKSSTAKISLVSLRDITEGEPLTIAFDPQDDQLGNANEQIDPRVISRQYWNKNQIVLKGEDRMPQDIPRSYEPNCELVEINDDDDNMGGASLLALRALVDIPEGGVFCILPDDDEEYEEVEVDLGTGELL